MFVGDSSTTCSMMSLMESILTTELTKSLKQLAGREYPWVHRLDGLGCPQPYPPAVYSLEWIKLGLGINLNIFLNEEKLPVI